MAKEGRAFRRSKPGSRIAGAAFLLVLAIVQGPASSLMTVECDDADICFDGRPRFGAGTGGNITDGDDESMRSTMLLSVESVGLPQDSGQGGFWVRWSTSASDDKEPGDNKSSVTIVVPERATNTPSPLPPGLDGFEFVPGGSGHNESEIKGRDDKAGNGVSEFLESNGLVMIRSTLVSGLGEIIDAVPSSTEGTDSIPDGQHGEQTNGEQKRRGPIVLPPVTPRLVHGTRPIRSRNRPAVLSPPDIEAPKKQHSDAEGIPKAAPSMRTTDSRNGFIENPQGPVRRSKPRKIIGNHDVEEENKGSLTPGMYGKEEPIQRADNGSLSPLPTPKFEDCILLTEGVAQYPGLLAFSRVLEVSGLDDYINSINKNLTLLTPPDVAFEDLAEKRSKTLTEFLEDEDSLKQIGRLHIVTDYVLSPDLTDHRMLETALTGTSLLISKTPESTLVVPPGGEAAEVQLIDIKFCDGVVHIIDKVLLPMEDKVIDLSRMS